MKNGLIKQFRLNSEVARFRLTLISNEAKTAKKKERIGVSYPVPVITTSTPKVENPLALEETVIVSVADRTWLADSVAPCRFQLKVTGPLAVEGLQFVSDILSVSCELPRFLT